jgi:hypothetical protein
LAEYGCGETKRTLPYVHRDAEAVKRNVKVRSKEWPSGQAIADAKLMGETSERQACGIVRQESQKHVMCFRTDSLESRKRQLHGRKSLVEVV